MKKISFKENIWFPVEEFKLTEKFDVNNNPVGIIIEGNALDTETPTRNGILYDYNSVLNTFKMLEGKPMLINHDETKFPIGHVEKVWMEGKILKYRANLDPEEKDLIRKIKRGDIRNVSIQTMVEEVIQEENMNGQSYTRAFPNDWAELSIVTIPGYADSSINMLEKLKNNKEDINTSNAGALTKTVISDKVRKVPTKKITKEAYKEMSDVLEIIKIIDKIGG